MATVILGAQWGDEGKGKLSDILCRDAQICARAAGGHNAGHSVVVDGVSYHFHLLPSGLINPGCINLIGTGVVFNLEAFWGELTDLEKKGLKGVRDRIFVSDRAHVNLKLHALVDGLEEVELGTRKIGTTGRGIGPTYANKAARNGIRVHEIFDQETFEATLRKLAAGYKKRFGDLLDYDVEEEIARFREYRETLAPFVVDAVKFMKDAQDRNAKILIEGANALMLDIDYGTYPFVTSSNTGLGGVVTGLAVNPMKLGQVIGVVKAYTTRVGEGLFKTEDLGEIGQTLQDIGREWGVSTGRKRRCGHLDLVVLKYSASINHYTALNLTKLDVLDTLPIIKVAVAYKDRETGQEIDYFPADLGYLENKCDVVYRDFEGWQTPTTAVKKFEDLPKQAQTYVNFIEEYTGVRVAWIGTGPSRDDMIFSQPVVAALSVDVMSLGWAHQAMGQAFFHRRSCPCLILLKVGADILDPLPSRCTVAVVELNVTLDLVCVAVMSCAVGRAATQRIFSAFQAGRAQALKRSQLSFRGACQQPHVSLYARHLSSTRAWKNDVAAQKAKNLSQKAVDDEEQRLRPDDGELASKRVNDRPWQWQGTASDPQDSRQPDPTGGDKTKGRLMTTPTRLLKLILPVPFHPEQEHINETEEQRRERGEESVEPLALLVHPQQPLSYLERLIQAEIPPLRGKGKERLPDIIFRAEADHHESHHAQNKNGSNVASYTGLGREGPTKEEAKWVRWSGSTEIGDFIRDAARGREFAIEIEGYGRDLRVAVPSFKDRTYYMRDRLKRMSLDIDQMSKLKKECDLEAHKGAHRLAQGGFAVLIGWWGIVYYFSFHTEMGWDLVEPITYLAGLTTIMGGYLWFLFISRDLSYKAAMNVTVSKRQNALYQARGFDLQKWEQLVNEANALRKEIRTVAQEYGIEWDEKRDLGNETVKVLEKEKSSKDKRKDREDDNDEKDESKQKKD